MPEIVYHYGNPPKEKSEAERLSDEWSMLYKKTVEIERKYENLKIAEMTPFRDRMHEINIKKLVLRRPECFGRYDCDDAILQECEQSCPCAGHKAKSMRAQEADS